MLPTEGLLLPPTSAFFPADKAEPDPYLYQMKDATNAVKSKLDSKAIGPWRNHTQLMLQTAELTQAIRKFNVLCSLHSPFTDTSARSASQTIDVLSPLLASAPHKSPTPPHPPT